VCIKVIDYQGLKNPGEEKMIESEIMCLREVENRYIIKCYDVLKSKQFCYIITEVCNNGDLYRQLHYKKCFT
jgi:serine/threonine protein kinase